MGTIAEFLARAAVWLQTFVPPEVLYETEPQGVARFLAGDLFMIRTWVQGAGEIKSQLPPDLEVDLTAVPGGGALGGHGVMVAALSPNADAAAFN